MSKTSLEFTVSIEAGEPMVQSIKAALIDNDAALTQALVNAIQEKLKAADINDDCEIKIPNHRVTIKTAYEGGLNAQEWLDKGGLADSDQQISNFQD